MDLEEVASASGVSYCFNYGGRLLLILGFATIVYTIVSVVIMLSNVPWPSVLLILGQLGAAHVVILGCFLDVACSRKFA